MGSGESHFVTLPNQKINLHVMDWGKTEPEVIVFLHGLASSCHMFDLLVTELDTSYRMIAPDQRGHGLSDKPSSGYDFETIAADLDDLLLALTLSSTTIHLIGHSWGAYISLYYAATRPDRLKTLTLLDGGIRRIGDAFSTWEEAEIGMSPPTYHNRSLADIQQMIEKDWLGSAFRPELAPLALSIFDTSNPNDVHAHLERVNHMQIAHALWEFDPLDYYSRVTCPTLIVNAVQPEQPISSELRMYTEIAEQNIRQVRVEWMHETIHDIPWHRPHELGIILKDFLQLER